MSQPYHILLVTQSDDYAFIAIKKDSHFEVIQTFDDELSAKTYGDDEFANDSTEVLTLNEIEFMVAENFCRLLGNDKTADFLKKKSKISDDDLNRLYVNFLSLQKNPNNHLALSSIDGFLTHHHLLLQAGDFEKVFLELQEKQALAEQEFYQSLSQL